MRMRRRSVNMTSPTAPGRNTATTASSRRVARSRNHPNLSPPSRLLNTRVIVSLWTIQLATVLFLAAGLTAFLLFGNDHKTPPSSHVSASAIVLAVLSIPYVFILLIWEARLFVTGMKGKERIGIRPFSYLVVQMVKLQTGNCWILLWKDLTKGGSVEWKGLINRASAMCL